MAVIVHKDTAKTVNTIALRNAISPKRDHMIVLVKDASADASVREGNAIYRYEKETTEWILISKSNTDTFSFQTDKLTIQGESVNATYFPADGNIWNLTIREAGVIIVDSIDYTVVNGVVTVIGDLPNQFDGKELVFTYAYGAITAQINDILALKLDSNVDQELIGHLVPAEANTYTLGSAAKPFKDLYVGANSLYVNGQKIVSDNNGIMKFTADVNQNVEFSASGTGAVNITTAGEGDVKIDPTGTGKILLKGTVKIDASEKLVTDTGGPLVIGNGVVVEGDLAATTINGHTVSKSIPADADFTDTETNTTLALVGDILSYTDELGQKTELSLSAYIDDTNLSRLVSAVIGVDGIATFTREDDSTFNMDMSIFLNGTKLTEAEIVGFGFVKDTDLDALSSTVEANRTSAFDTDRGLKETNDRVIVGSGLNSTGIYTPDNAAEHINGATSLKDADSKLDAAIKANADDLLNETAARSEDTFVIQANIGTISSAISNEQNIRAEADLLAQNNINVVANSVSAEQNARVGAVNSVATNLTTEINNRIVGDNAGLSATQTVADNLNLETNNRAAAEGILQDSIDANAASVTAEQNARLAADNTLTASVTSEAATRAAADNNLQTNINTTNARINAILEASTTDADSFKEIVDLINSVDTSNDNVFGTYVTNNNVRVGAIESDLSTTISNLAGETNTRAAADVLIGDNLADEINDRIAGDLQTQGNIDTLTNNLNLESANRISNDSGLLADINTQKSRIDAILSSSAADADSFAEIVGLINSVDTVNDDAFGGYVTTNNARSTAMENDISTLQSTLTTETSNRVAGDNALTAQVAAITITPVIVISNITANVGERLFVDTSAAARIVTLPSNPANFDEVHFVDLKGQFDLRNLTIARNGNDIMGLAEDMVVSSKNISIAMVYINGDWRVL